MPDSSVELATASQLTSHSTAVAPMVAAAVCAMVRAARMPAARNQRFQSVFAFI